uniref:Uncharacterized protein n=1 Tax=Mycena chlorophos TaxID=658473 RepID=A0ABQ0LES7_MYCCL|nr:predicted protein [Mycena chlorophos]
MPTTTHTAYGSTPPFLFTRVGAPLPYPPRRRAWAASGHGRHHPSSSSPSPCFPRLLPPPAETALRQSMLAPSTAPALASGASCGPGEAVAAASSSPTPPLVTLHSRTGLLPRRVSPVAPRTRPCTTMDGNCELCACTPVMAWTCASPYPRSMTRSSTSRR